MYKNLEEIIYRGCFHLDRRLLKEPLTLKTKISLDYDLLYNQHDPPLQTNPPVPAIISTYNLIAFGELTSTPNLPPVLSPDSNTYKGAYGEITNNYFQMTWNNDQVKYNYKAIIDKGKKLPE